MYSPYVLLENALISRSCIVSLRYSYIGKKGLLIRFRIRLVHNPWHLENDEVKELLLHDALVFS